MAGSWRPYGNTHGSCATRPRRLLPSEGRQREALMLFPRKLPTGEDLTRGAQGLGVSPGRALPARVAREASPSFNAGSSKRRARGTIPGCGSLRCCPRGPPSRVQTVRGTRSPEGRALLCWLRVCWCRWHRLRAQHPISQATTGGLPRRSGSRDVRTGVIDGVLEMASHGTSRERNIDDREQLVGPHRGEAGAVCGRSHDTGAGGRHCREVRHRPSREMAPSDGSGLVLIAMGEACPS